VRLFFAVELPPEVRAAAAAAGRRLQAALAAGARDARWIPEENLHITLWFLGEVEPARLAALESATFPFSVAPFDIHLGGVGLFPPAGPPRVIWMGIRSGGEGLAALHAELSDRLPPLGFKAERRRFAPHLTLARVRDRPAHGGAQAVRRTSGAERADAGVARVEAVSLVRSRLSPRGAVYLPVLRVPLGG
jgi:RNA 2',3'-cyclic 3'-phosphodiesterase